MTPLRILALVPLLACGDKDGSDEDGDDKELEEDDKIHEWTMLPVVHPSPASEEGGESEEAVERRSSLSEPDFTDFSEAEQMLERRRKGDGEADSHAFD